MGQTVIATGNAGKVAEIQRVLTGRIDAVAQSVFGVDEAEETGRTFVENAIIKARHAAQHTGLPAIADDSGLEVDALRGAPGVFSARYAGENATSADNIARLLRELSAVRDDARSARFRCVIVLLRHADDPTPLICEGAWNGRIASAPRGDRGFGYDPVFFVPELRRTAAELTPDHKNRISHRGQALAELLERLSSRQPRGGA